MTSADFAAYEAKCAAAKARADEILPTNKVVLFDALARVGIETVVVCFDGAGDSGQIETITGYGDGDTEIDLPTETLTLGEVEFDTAAVNTVTRGMRATIERMAYAFLEETHSGWEDGEGAYGEFTFSVADRSITLEYSERYTATNDSVHEF